jgi:hypothetical protein
MGNMMMMIPQCVMLIRNGCRNAGPLTSHMCELYRSQQAGEMDQASHSVMIDECT